MPPAPVSRSWSPVETQDGPRLTFGASTHPGTLRELNEDGWFAGPPVFVVADGMGGHRAGDVASAIVVSTFDDLVRDETVDVASVQRCIARCQERISSLGGDRASAPGSTLVAAAYVSEDDTSYWLLANIGDSRAYQLTGEGLEQLSRDHTLVQELIDAGQLQPEGAATHPERHVITRALGALDDAPADYSLIPVVDGSVLLLCSDGVTAELDDGTIARLLGSNLGARGAADAIVEAAVRAGGRDNATAVVIEVHGTGVTVDTIGAGER